MKEDEPEQFFPNVVVENKCYLYQIVKQTKVKVFLILFVYIFMCVVNYLLVIFFKYGNDRKMNY